MYDTEIAIGNFGMMAVNLYLNIVYLERSLEVYNKLESVMQDRVKKLEVMSQYGVAKKDKLSLAQAQLMNVQSQKIKILSDLDIAKMEYKTTLQQEPEELSVPEMINYKLPLDNKEDFIAKTLVSNYQLLKSNADTKTSHALFITSTMNTLPDIGIEAGLKNTSIVTPLNNFNIDQKYVAFAVSIGFNTQANTISNARKTYKLYRINQLKQNLDTEKIKQEAVSTWNNYHSMLELIKAAKKSLEISENALQEVTIAAKTGLATTTDEDEAKQAVLEANLNLITAQKNAVMLYYKIHSMIGISNLSNI
jgi:outer membrane protein